MPETKYQSSMRMALTGIRLLTVGRGTVHRVHVRICVVLPVEFK